MSQKKKLFISFSSLVADMKNGVVTTEDLESALFCFGCSREYLEGTVRDNYDVRLQFGLRSQEEIDAGKQDYDRADIDLAEEIYGAIKEMVFEAEKEGRVRYTHPRTLSSVIELNRLLELNGIETSSVRHLEGDRRYNHSLVQKNYGGLVDVMTR